jgi:hypothetical protein
MFLTSKKVTSIDQRSRTRWWYYFGGSSGIGDEDDADGVSAPCAVPQTDLLAIFTVQVVP